MENINVLIVEDKALVAKGIEVMLNKHGLTVMRICASGEEAIEVVKKEKPELILMDIQLAGVLDGIATMEAIHTMMDDVPVIYLSDHVDAHTVERAKKTLPANYLSKPFQDLDLIRAIDIAFSNSKAKAKSSAAGEKYILIRTDTQHYVRLVAEDILYLEAARAYCKVVTTTKAYTISTSMNHVQELMEHPDFVRVHRKYTVNLSQINEIKGNTIRIGKHEVQLSRDERETLMSRLKIIK